MLAATVRARSGAVIRDRVVTMWALTSLGDLDVRGIEQRQLEADRFDGGVGNCMKTWALSPVFSVDRPVVVRGRLSVSRST
jgi:hypothetical protein